MSRAIAQIGSTAPLSEAAQRMTEASISSVVVTEACKPVGILTEQDMLRLFSAGTSTATPVAEVMSAPVTTALATDTFTGMWMRMTTLGLRHLVVVDTDGIAVGLVSESDFRNHMDGPMLTRMGGLADLMERELPELPPDASLQDALRLMLHHRSTYVVITWEQRALGILTERDIPRLMAHTASGTDLSHQPLITLAHTPLHTVSADTWMVEAAAQMQRLKVRHLAVVNAEGLLVINHRKDGSDYTESVRISPVQQPDGHVTHYLAIKEDITRQKQAEQQIYKLAYFDVLTGLPNRQLLADRFQQAVNLVKRQKMPLALMFIDLDHFKNINDTLGHSAGDDLLIQVARRLESLVRAGDTLSRQGGDEFVLVLPGCGSEEAAAVANKLVQQHNRSITLGAQEVVVTLSIGISVFPTDGSDFETLSKSADMAMYQAKLAGRNTWRQFKPDMQARSSRTLMLENSLRQAMDKGQLELVYQPQVSLANGELLGLEALLRWRHPDLGMVSPTEFIPLAETSGQILRMGEWVMHTAARQLKTWLDQGMPPVTMAVNLSAIQFRDPGLVATVARVLHETGLPPTCLELELTESIAMSDPLGAVATIDELHAMQVTMSIDDFGTGYSSLSYLKRFKVSKLKIDQSFVRDITTDPEDKAIVSAIIGLASNLGLRTIAEGVETPGQLAWLRLQGCDEAQGYFFSTPLTPLEFPTWMARHQPGSAPAQPTAT